MEAFVEKGNLFLLYSGLLKEKQRQIYEYHILEDMSFTEIGLEMGITRQAAQAVFRKADEKLKFFTWQKSGLVYGVVRKKFRTRHGMRKSKH